MMKNMFVVFLCLSVFSFSAFSAEKDASLETLRSRLDRQEKQIKELKNIIQKKGNNKVSAGKEEDGAAFYEDSDDAQGGGYFKARESSTSEPSVTFGAFVDVGYADPGSQTSGHHYAEAPNGQNTLNRLTNQSFLFNELNIHADVEYGKYISGYAEVAWYPMVNSNLLEKFSTLRPDSGTAFNNKFGYIEARAAYADLRQPWIEDLDLKLRVGKMPSILGQDQATYKSPDNPMISHNVLSGFTSGYPTGIQLLGKFPLIHSDLAVGLTHDANGEFSAFPASATRNLPFANANGNKVFSFKWNHNPAYWKIFKGVNMGFSGQVGHKGSSGVGDDGQFWSYHPHLRWTVNPWPSEMKKFIGNLTFRGEWLYMRINNRIAAHANGASGAANRYNFLFTPVADLTATSEDGDVRHQGYYLTSSLDFFDKFTGTFSYSQLNSHVIRSISPLTPARFYAWGFARAATAVRYSFNRYVHAKAEWQVNKEHFGAHGGADLRNNVLTSSLVFSF